MNKRDSKKSKKIRKLIVFCSLTSFIFIVATYAWFIGMRQVNVSSFEIEIASTDSLLLSLDGSKWDTTVTINSENFNDTTNTVYTGNVNNWAGEGTDSINKGLKPISSVGEIDTTTSTMKMFEKGSLTATPGGYRLMASRIHNYDAPLGGFTDDAEPKPIGQYKEIGGYVAFDLFIRNFSGREYYAENNVLNEEAIYLTDDSKVEVKTTGANAGVASTGIENSVRVAFAQIGRVNGKTTDVSKITGISCATGDDVTGICRTAQIWEPNDTAHVANAISYYDTSCRLRPNAVSPATDPTDITQASAYTADSHCGTVKNGFAYHTYAVNDVISYTDKIDVYDGGDYNGYTANVRTYKNDGTINNPGKLYAYDYFTDSEKVENGMARPELITLAPNSITKVRIYVWIEGQDIDNYDFASIGKQITVNFGFTKERFDENEIQGSGPYMSRTDSTKPTITVATEKKTVEIAQGATFDPMDGVTATDVEPLVPQAYCSDPVTDTWGTDYKCLNSAGEQLTELTTEATCRPDDSSTNEWVATCTRDLTTKIQVTNPVTTSTPVGTGYVVRYLVSDWQGNYAEATKTVNVTAGS